MARGGVYVVKIGEIKVFVQKLCLKQGFFEDTNLDHLTSGWPGTHCFRGDANFSARGVVWGQLSEEASLR